MIKKSIFAIITFIIFFTVFMLFLFPYDTVAKYFLHKAINEYKLPVNYASLEASAFGAKLSGIDYYYNEKFSIGSVSVNYSPLSLITRSVSATTVDSPVSANMHFKKNNILFHADQSVDEILKIYPKIKKYAKSGNINIKGQINPFAEKGKISVILSNLSLITPITDVKFDQISADFELNKNRLTITNVKSNGSNNVNIKGTVFINYNALIHSVVNLEGSIDIAGFKNNFTIKGRVSNPRIIF